MSRTQARILKLNNIMKIERIYYSNYYDNCVMGNYSGWSIFCSLLCRIDYYRKHSRRFFCYRCI
jgi:hypothetical protein